MRVSSLHAESVSQRFRMAIKRRRSPAWQLDSLPGFDTIGRAGCRFDFCQIPQTLFPGLDVQKENEIFLTSENVKYVNKSTARTLRILSEFTKGMPSLGTSEIASRLGMTKNLVHRSLQVLADEGFVVQREDTRRYELGYGVLSLSNDSVQNVDVKIVCQPFMDQIQSMTGLTVSLQIPAGQCQIPVHGVDGQRSGLTRVVQGVPVPLHISSGSRAILAFLGEDEIQRYIQDNTPLRKMTKNSLVEPSKLLANLKTIREAGYARGLEDHYLGVRAVSFPVLGKNGRPHASMTVVGANASISEDEMQQLIPRLKLISDDINRVAQLQLDDPDPLS